MIAQAEEFYQQLRAAVETDQLKLPSLPDVALNVRKAVDDDNQSAQQIAAIIGQDPSLATRLLQLANSPLYRTRSEIDTLPMAITRLGVRIVRDLVTTLAMRQLFRTDSRTLEAHFRALWSTSVRVAAICHTLADGRPGLDREQAMLAGLIHNIGALPLLMLAREDAALINDRQQLHTLTGQLQGRVGQMILGFWNFPHTLVEVVGQCHDWQRDHPGEADYVDLVQVALSESTYPEPPGPIQPQAAYAKMGLAGYGSLFEDEQAAVDIEQAQHTLMTP